MPLKRPVKIVRIDAKRVLRLKNTERLKKLGGEKIKAASHKGDAISENLLKFNSRVNMIGTLDAVFSGKLTGAKETPQSLNEKMIEARFGKDHLSLVKPVIKGYLETLGYGELLKKDNGLLLALQAYYRERKAARLLAAGIGRRRK